MARIHAFRTNLSFGPSSTVNVLAEFSVIAKH